MHGSRPAHGGWTIFRDPAGPISSERSWVSRCPFVAFGVFQRALMRTLGPRLGANSILLPGAVRRALRLQIHSWGIVLASYLVTGAAGFIGRSIAAALLARGESVRGIDNFITGKRASLAGLEGMEFIEGDLSDPAACARACDGIEIVFHEAALASVPRSVTDPVSTNTHCVTATLNLLVAARAAGVRRVIYAGSSSAYGDTPTLPKIETMLPNPISPYAVAKLAGEQYMMAFTRVYGLETVVLRYFNVFGPHQDPTSHYSGVLAIFCRRMLAGEQPTIYGDGEQSRDFTYIDNVVHANLLAAAAPAEKVAGRMMNSATGSRITLNETFAILRELTGYRGEPAYSAARAGDIRDSLADIKLAGELIEYRPIVDFREGLRRTVEWYRASAG
jgi:nucleoside-diphosphate-sugar epimerase